MNVIKHHSRRAPHRKLRALRASAFTLVEMLIAIGIILLLMGLLIAAIAPALTGARESATKAVIVQLESQLQERLSAFNTMMDNDARGTTTDAMIQTIKRAYNCNDADAKALYRKIRYRMEFPQRVADLIFNPDGSLSNYDSPLLESILQAKGIDKTSLDTLALQKLDEEVTSSEILYLLLTEGRSLGSESYSLEGLSAQHVTDQDKNSLMEIRDSWGNELSFYATPTALFRPDPDVPDPVRSWIPAMNLRLGARFHISSIMGDDGSDAPAEGSLYQDPFDRRASVLTLWMRNKPPAADPLTRAAFYYHPATYFSYLIVSGGPDGDSGLREPNFGSDKLPELDAARHAQPRSHDPNSVEFGAMFDNITNLNLRK